MKLPKTMLHLESLALLVGILIAYEHLGYNGWLLLGLLLVPDTAMLGYLVNVRVGSRAYNIAHTYLTPLGLLGVGLLAGWTFGITLALIWVAHIAIDRTLGYGLKYPTTFKDTHLQRV